MKTDRRKQIFIRCCYGYSVSGMAVLVIGAILPSVIAEAESAFWLRADCSLYSPSIQHFCSAPTIN